MLRQRSRTPVWIALSWRILLALGLIGVALAVHWFDRDGLRDNSDGYVSLIDVVYFTMITVTTVGYGDIVPVTDRARLFDTFVVTPVRLFVWLIFLGTAYNFVFKQVWEKWRMRVLQRDLRGHVIVAGHGTSGTEAVAELIRRGRKPGEIVVIDPRADALDTAEGEGVIVLAGDATRNATLEAVRVGRASALIVAAGRDDTSILIVLTARRLAVDLPISVVIRSEDNEALATQAGANTVINPASFAGLLLAESTSGPHLADYMMDLAGLHGAVSLHERAVAPHEIGTPMSGLTTGMGLRVYRGGQRYGFWQSEVSALEADDRIIEIVPTTT
ncbi:potassium channel family protein [Sphingomonas sp. Leaf17]|uniref:potassium channel family protein n=1 Tax=Sphingomonas sp. Leaf17 TaxID=1735683 RepID=UPI000A5B032C|nr:potassium channel family protein [Sphingomonas sp. Leaf17]